MENLRKNINTVKFLLSAFWLFSLSFCVCVCACVCKLTFFPVEIRGRQVSPHDRLSLKHDRGSSCLSIGRPTSTGRPTYLIYLSCGSTCVTCSVRARARDRCSFFFAASRYCSSVAKRPAYVEACMYKWMWRCHTDRWVQCEQASEWRHTTWICLVTGWIWTKNVFADVRFYLCVCVMLLLSSFFLTDVGKHIGMRGRTVIGYDGFSGTEHVRTDADLYMIRYYK